MNILLYAKMNKNKIIINVFTVIFLRGLSLVQTDLKSLIIILGEFDNTTQLVKFN